MVAIHRTLIESERYTADLAKIEPDVRRTDLIQEDFGKEVACRAEFFPLIEGTTLRFVRTRPDLGGCPALQAARIAEELLPPSIFHDE
jgi:hypothetical protein